MFRYLTIGFFYDIYKAGLRQHGESGACTRLPLVEVTVVQKQHQGTPRKTGGIRFPAAFGYFFRKK